MCVASSVRMLCCLAVLAVFLPSGSDGTSAAGEPGAAGELNAVLNEEERTALREGLQDGRIISPEAARRLTRAFVADPRARFRCTGYEDADDVGYGAYFTFAVTGLSGGETPEAVNINLSAIDGKPISLRRVDGTEFEGPATVSKTEAAGIAERFLRRCWPEFGRRKWAQDYPPSSSETQSSEFSFTWTEVLGEHSVRAADDLRVHVEKSTGRVVESFFPRDRPCCPLAPRVTLEQARRLAGPLAAVDPAIHPFERSKLRLVEGDHGIMALVWLLSQHVPEEVREKIAVSGHVRLDAMSGDNIWTLASPVDNEPWRRVRRAEAYETYRQLTEPGVLPANLFLSSRPVTALVDPELREGEVWLRIELLRDCGVRVFGTPRRPVLRFRNRRIFAEELGAHWRKYAWWMPLGRVARAFGWKVRRDDQTKWVYIDVPEPR